MTTPHPTQRETIYFISLRSRKLDREKCFNNKVLLLDAPEIPGIEDLFVGGESE